MPCNSDYMEPTRLEEQLQQTARLIVYVYSKLHAPCESWIKKQADNIYARDRRVVPLLCRLICEMSPKQRKAIVYNAFDKRSRELADWWEIHQAADANRKAEARKKRAKKKLIQRAKAKLTKKEREALGL